MRLTRLFALPIAVLAVTECGGGDLQLPPEGSAFQVELVDGNGQTGDPGAVLGSPITVRVVDESGNGVPGRIVSWVVSDGGGSTSPQRSATAEDGTASAQWRLGPAPGANALSATVDGVGSVDFTATAQGETGGAPSASASEISADPTSILADAGLSTITVVVRDDGGNPVQGATVTLEATGDGNTLTQPSQPTGADGVASGTLQSHEPGTKVVSATVNGSVTLDATAQITVTPAPTQTTIEGIDGDNQSAPAGTPVAVRPAVRVVDDGDQPVTGVEVTFVVTSGGGEVEGATQTTNGDGIARVDSWTLGTTPGTNTLEARAPAAQGSPVVFTAQGTSAGGGTIDHFVFSVPPHDIAKNERFSVAVAMVDVNGAVVPLSGIVIYIGLFPDGSDAPANKHLLGNRFVATQNGVATFDDLAINKEGGYRIRALSDQLPQLGPHGPEPFLFSDRFVVTK